MVAMFAQLSLFLSVLAGQQGSRNIPGTDVAPCCRNQGLNYGTNYNAGNADLKQDFDVRVGS